MLKGFRKLPIVLLVLFLTFTISFAVYSWMQTDVSFFNESVSFSLSGTYTKNIYLDGTHKWEPSKPDTGTLTVWGTAKGIGHAFVEIVSGSIYMYPAAPSRDGGQIGVMRRSRQIPVIPIWKKEKGKCISTSDTVTNLPLGTGTYSWNAIGKFEKIGAKFNFITGWSDKHPTSHSKRGNGTWTVVHQKICPACKKPVKRFDDHLEATCTKNDWCNEANTYSCIHKCGESGSGDGKGNGDGDKNNNGNNDADGNEGANRGNTIGNLCNHVNCNTTITSNNASDHQFNTCSKCGEDYWTCSESMLAEHQWMVCIRNDCPVLFHRGSRFRVRNCQGNLKTCITINGTRRFHTLRKE